MDKPLLFYIYRVTWIAKVDGRAVSGFDIVTATTRQRARQAVWEARENLTTIIEVKLVCQA